MQHCKFKQANKNLKIMIKDPDKNWYKICDMWVKY